jgi:TrmH family RNA methyltransferase
MTVTLLLYKTENSENLGSIARAASNFDFQDILLVEPKCEVNEKSRWLAKHGLPTLERMKIVTEDVLKEFDILVATQGRNSTGYNLVRAPVTPRELAGRLNEIDALTSGQRIGILFGPEGEGLPKEIIAKADIVLAIPTSRDNPSMNLAQSVTVLLYELSLLRGRENKITLPYRPMNRLEHEALLKLVDTTLDQMHWKTSKQKETQRLVWRRMIGRSFLTKRECYALMGYLKKVHYNYEEKLAIPSEENADIEPLEVEEEHDE